MQILILCDHHDPTSVSVYHRLVAHAGTDVWLLSAAQMMDARWKHAIQDNGTVHTAIALRDGRTIDSSTIGAVLNRTRGLVAHHFTNNVDNEYGSMEWSALWLSWLQSLSCAVINPVRSALSGDLAGGNFHALDTLLHAGFAVSDFIFSSTSRRPGLKTFTPHARNQDLRTGGYAYTVDDSRLLTNQPAFYFNTPQQTRTIHVIGKRIFGATGPDEETCCTAFQQYTGDDVFGVELVKHAHDHQWYATGVNDYPAVEHAAEVDALAQLILEKTFQSTLTP